MHTKMTDPADIHRFVLGGNATFTLKNTVTGNRFTYKVAVIREDGRVSPHFVKLLTGPDNESSYEYMGIIRRETDYSYGGAKAKVPQNARAHRTFDWFWTVLNGKGASGKKLSDFPGFEFWHAGTCCRCGRLLTTPESIAKGIGPVCDGRD